MNKLIKIYQELLKKYDYQGWWPVDGKYFPNDYSYPKNEKQRFEIIVGAILTQNTSWKNVEKSLCELSKNKIDNWNQIINVSSTKLAKLIKSSGYFNQKVKKLKSAAKFFLDYKNSTPSRQQLLSVWGIGPETADSILSYAYKKPEFVIDAYTKRIFSRIGMCKIDTSYDKVKSLFEKNLKPDFKIFNEFHALIVKHAKQACLKNPKCDLCCLKNFCLKKY
jgi:endonuclease-3 related protein